MNKDLFRHNLLQWHQQIDRNLPWKASKSPYFIWLSEIMLQQTRIAQATPYYLKFVEAFPTVHDLANASEEKVFKLWEGLGYYSRARNLHATAKKVSQEMNGVFPDNYKDLLALKGIGPYTAAAIASFAYDLPHPVVDGNVFRVLSRVFKIEEAIDSTEGKKIIQAMAEACFEPKQAAAYNQAIMDFGAMVCTPKNVGCEHCEMQSFCGAYHGKMVDILPKKTKKIKKRDRYFLFVIIEDQDGCFLIEKRTKKDIWQGLFQFPLIENEQAFEDTKAIKKALRQNFNLKQKDFDWLYLTDTFKQTLSHQYIHARFLKIKMKKVPLSNDSQLLINLKELKNYGFPKIIDWFLKEKVLNLVFIP